MIGTLTFQNTINFGAMLQTYALQKKINDLGYECEVINYVCPMVVKNEKPLRLKDIDSLRKLLYYIFTNRYKKNQNIKFDQFYKDYVPSSAEYYTRDNIALINNIYDKIIVGSDQVWNLDLSGHDYTFFLDFINDNSKKHSYAASFGYDQLHDDIDKQYELLKSFKSLNVREDTGKHIIENQLGLNANTVCDPTLLLNKHEWESLIPSSDNKRNPYILVYLLNRNTENFNMIKQYAEKNHLEIIQLHNYLKSEYGTKSIRSASPLDFLQLVRDSEIVITGSFHALCFSMIFNKNFYYTRANHNRNSRVDDLMNIFKTTNRELSFDNMIKSNRIDFDEVNTILENMRHESISILLNTVLKG